MAWTREAPRSRAAISYSDPIDSSLARTITTTYEIENVT
jgi:hypothetical protein